MLSVYQLISWFWPLYSGYVTLREAIWGAYGNSPYYFCKTCKFKVRSKLKGFFFFFLRNVGLVARGARHDKEAEDNLVTEVMDLKQTFLKSNMKAKRYKPASRQDIRTKSFPKAYVKRMH